MDERKALLILHGKQAGNDEVRAAVEARRKAGWALVLRVHLPGCSPLLLANGAP